ncbi:(2Fe-2S) ferredoxin domain-containing protein [Azospirillum melinis]|uniref:(2Fe-2S) ferredoxin domain-containing protein n=1 Tax=Azospirillum melinis TaxID=328839 RepID=UPI00375825FA
MTETPANPPSRRAIVLYGRASFDHGQNLKALASALAARHAARGEAVTVTTAHADLSGPALPGVLADLERDGVTEALVIPAMVPADPSLSAWLPGALSHWATTTGTAMAGTAMAIRLAPPVESALDLPAALDRIALNSIAGGPADALAQDVRGTEPSLGKPGWSAIPEHGRQLFVCVGARCLHRGAEPLYQHLRATMKGHRALNAGPRRAMCARTSCLYPCNRGPLLVVQPDAVWYGDLTPAKIDRIVTGHLLSDTPPAADILHRNRPAERAEDAPMG